MAGTVVLDAGIYSQPVQWQWVGCTGYTQCFAQCTCYTHRKKVGKEVAGRVGREVRWVAGMEVAVQQSCSAGESR